MSLHKEIIVNYLLQWHKENYREFPWRTERTPYRVLVAEFFLQRTPASRVKVIFSEFIKRYPTPCDLANSDLNALKKEYSKLGLLKRFDWLVKTMKIICDKYDSKIPTKKQDLLKLPGIGEYTASAFLTFAHNIPVEIIDSNVRRLYSRLYHVINRDIGMIASELIPIENSCNFNEALLDYSAIICQKYPKCNVCGLRKMCKYYIVRVEERC